MSPTSSEKLEHLRECFSSVLLPNDFRYDNNRNSEYSNSVSTVCHDPESLDANEKNNVSAVLVLLKYVGAGDWQILLNVRSKSLSRHPGEVCFPGGMRDTYLDQSPLDTALREANEEIGLKADELDVIGILPSLFTRHSIFIFPILAILHEQVEPSFNLSAEVDHLFWAPLEKFLSRHRYDFIDIENDFRIHAFFLEHPVFGITAAISIVVAIGVYDRMPDFEFPPLSSGESSPRAQLWRLFENFGRRCAPIPADILRQKFRAALRERMRPGDLKVGKQNEKAKL